MKELLQELNRVREIYFSKMRTFREFLVEHSVQRKLLFVGALVAGMVLLLIGTRLAPQKSDVADSALDSEQPLGSSGATTIKMTSRSYNAQEKYMMIRFKVHSSQVIDPSLIKLEAKTFVSQNAKYQVLALANGSFVVILSNLQSGYRAVQVKASTKSPNITKLQDQASSVGASSSSDGDTTTTDSSNKPVKFTINEDKSFINNKLKKLNRNEYAIGSLEGSINLADKKIAALNKLIRGYEKQIANDRVAIDSAKQEDKYHVGKSTEEISNAKSDISSQQGAIKTEKRKIEKQKQQQELYKLNIADIEAGNYKFPAIASAKKIE